MTCFDPLALPITGTVQQIGAAELPALLPRL
jgi:hypothetical protein